MAEPFTPLTEELCQATEALEKLFRQKLKKKSIQPAIENTQTTIENSQNHTLEEVPEGIEDNRSLEFKNRA